ncbi:protein-tyrosine phosphatase-like protein [Pseudoneurospora amorphoporcata]|uniref:Protein-tyrosine phosphatase-like protein n=1 Tax=Pseudoneurospora amorphoporcata TaxID=241081 RepID=A0AAN6NXX7_9PEZI|nr:protein-tyrosine phosphatase-like protein [Pseudoneurospora amorphoporcata]
MDHFPRLRPHRRKRDITAPSLITTPTTTAKSADSTSEKAESPASAELHTLTAAPLPRPVYKLSPFRVFSRSSKRAREASPGSHKQTPTAAAVMASNGTVDHPASPAESKTSLGQQVKNDGRPKMPSFLELSDSEIENKFQEIIWLERKRILEATMNPSRDFRWARVMGSHLRQLDRYGNIQPWHNNRIKLQVPEGKTDYINASPIVLNPTVLTTADGDASNTQEPDRYIAMQGPKRCTTDHVWRMAVEQLESPGVIVMLTETHEGDYEKCYQYFPRTPEDPPLEINERDEFDDGFRATVRCAGIEDTPAGDAIELRKMVIRVHKLKARKSMDSKNNGSQSNRQTPEPESAVTEEPKITSPLTQMAKETEANLTISGAGETVGRNSGEEDVEERIVWHFLYKKWPDFGVPDLADLDSFFILMGLSREKNAGPHNPRIVHCSAGVGRSGTFIALEHLMRELDAGVLENWDERCPAGAGDSSSSTPSARTSQDELMSPTSSTKGGEDNDLIFQVVNQLREQRKTMVQADSQYLFIYQVMRKLWLDKYGGDDGGDSSSGERAAKRLEVDPGDPFYVNGYSKK